MEKSWDSGPFHLSSSGHGLSLAGIQSVLLTALEAEGEEAAKAGFGRVTSGHCSMLRGAAYSALPPAPWLKPQPPARRHRAPFLISLCLLGNLCSQSHLPCSPTICPLALGRVGQHKTTGHGEGRITAPNQPPDDGVQKPPSPHAPSQAQGAQVTGQRGLMPPTPAPSSRRAA